MLPRKIGYNRIGWTISRYVSTHTVPPSHFSNPYTVPRPYEENSPLPNTVPNIDPVITPTQTHSSAHASPQSPLTNNKSYNNEQSDRSSSLKEITSLIAMYVLAYIAIDNYTSRIKLETLNKETSAITQKALQVQQANFLNARKKRDLQIIQERRDIARRNFKMGLHIALLRKQLSEMGVDPLEIDDAVREFEKNVKADNSVKNVSGQALWLDDNSPLKTFLPDAHDYDKRDRKENRPYEEGKGNDDNA